MFERLAVVGDPVGLLVLAVHWCHCSSAPSWNTERCERLALGVVEWMMNSPSDLQDMLELLTMVKRPCGERALNSVLFSLYLLLAPEPNAARGRGPEVLKTCLEVEQAQAPLRCVCTRLRPRLLSP